MNYLSVCSGIEAATVAWKNLGWNAVGFSEIEPFPSAVLKHHYPTVNNYGDINGHYEWKLPEVNLLVGGTPCQSFSIAGLRKGLEDPRGNIMLVYLGIIESRRPRWIVWENVPGVLSSNRGRDFGTFLAALGELGYGFAYRVLDAQWFGVPQRRRRVFVVGCLGDTTSASKVLFESESVQRNIAPIREKGQGITSNVENRLRNGGASLAIAFEPGIATREGGESRFTEEVTGTLRQNMGDNQTAVAYGTDLYNGAITGDVAVTITSNTGSSATHSGPTVMQSTSIGIDCYNGAITGDIAVPLTSRADGTGTGPTVIQSTVVRRLTPIECERLQGFPDKYTEIPWRKKPSDQCPDGPRYKALGNSMAVPVMRWIGERIAMVDSSTK